MPFAAFLLTRHQELRVAVDPSYNHTNKQLLQNVKELYGTDDDIDIYGVFKMGKTINDHLANVILDLPSEHLECKKLLVT